MVLRGPLIGKDACNATVPTPANISAIVGFPGDVAGAVSVDSAVPIVIPFLHLCCCC